MSDMVRAPAAVKMLMAGLNIGHEQAVRSICQRAAQSRMFAIADEVVGYSPDWLPRMPNPTDFQPVWPFLWKEDWVRDPNSLLWSVGDLEMFWTNMPGETLLVSGVRFYTRDILGMIDGNAVPINDNAASLPQVSNRLGAIAAVGAKWNWDSVLAELVALAAGPDGLEAIEGFSMPRNGQAPRGSQARIEEWMTAAFERRNGLGNGPSPSEIRARAKGVIEALLRAGNG